jgi:hypothetical protein
VIPVSATARAILDGSYTYHLRVSSWLGETLLADEVPVAAATEDSDRSLNVPERVSFTVPRQADGFDWTPTTDTHPLAAKGQTLKVTLGVSLGTAGIEWFQRGEFLIIESVDDGESIRVTAAGLLYLIDEAKFASPFQPTGTIASTLRQLIEPALTADLDSAPADRSVTAGLAASWDNDRLAALRDLLDVWAADMFVNEQGYLEVVPDVTPTAAVRSFTNARGGTLVSASGSSTRDGGFNVVVVTGYAADGGEVRGVADVNNGPWSRFGGAANPLPVPYAFSSPLLTTNFQCISAAYTILRRKMRQAVLREFTVTCTPDPTIQLGDPVAITTDYVTNLLCTVEALTLPYVAGAMTLKVVSTV